jgi:large subunit ribosomal protein L23
MNLVGKEKRHGKYSGRKPSWKKAYVKLKKDAKMIEYFEVV